MMKRFIIAIFVIMIGLLGFCLNANADIVFDFNASGHAVSSSDSNDGDITEPYILTQDRVTLTVSPKYPPTNTENRFWDTNNGPQLRCYSGTITIESTGAMKSISFDAPSKFDLIPDNGTLTGTTWNGSSERVIFTVNRNTYINSITILEPIDEDGEHGIVNGFYYRFNNVDMTARLAKNVDNNPTVIIPEQVDFKENKYTVVSIDDNAFYGCSGLTSITIPNSVTSIGNSAFYGCSGLTSITIPNSVISIGNYAFCDCSGLLSLSISNSLTTIGKWTFYNCSGLTSLTIPISVTSIGSGAFDRCTSLTKVIVPVSDYSEFCNNKVVGLVFSYIGKPVTLIDKQGSEIKDFPIPEGVTSIGDRSFCNCSGLSTITIGSGVTSIGDNAFANIPNMTDVYCYAENVPTISSNAFGGSYIEGVTLHVPANSVELYTKVGLWKTFKEIVAIVEPPSEKCATPTIAFANGQLSFECETEGVEFVTNISLANMENNSKVDLFSVYRFSVYAKKNGYLDSDVASVNIDLNRLNGDINHDGQYTIADAVAIVNNILNDKTVIDPIPKFYYSVGTEAVTTENYTTVNNAHYKLSLSDIPETLDLSAISQQQAVILLPERCMPIIRDASGLVGTTSVSLDNGHMVYTTTSTINGAECTCTILK